jgi:hypothetical protein
MPTLGIYELTTCRLAVSANLSYWCWDALARILSASSGLVPSLGIQYLT